MNFFAVAHTPAPAPAVLQRAGNTTSLRPSVMGKKHRQSSAGKTNNTGIFDIAKVDEPRVNRKDAIIDKWNTDADIPDEPEDAFDRSRDQVLLDPAARLSRGRGDDDDDDIDMGREVMGLNARYSDSDDESAHDEGAAYDPEDLPKGRRQLAKTRLAAKKAGELPEAPKPATARLGTPDSSDESSNDEGRSSSDEDEVDERAKASYFGRNKYAYHGGDDLEALESDEDIDEETKIELEVREARKVQALAREDMTDADFGLAYAIPPKTGTEQVRPEVAPAIAGIRIFKDRSAGGAMDSAEEREARRAAFEAPTDASRTDLAPPVPEVDEDDIRANPRKARNVLLSLLRKSAPEKIALAGEFGDELAMYQEVSQALPERVAQHRARRAENAQDTGIDSAADNEDPGMGLLQLHAQVYNAYATCLSFFMYLATLPSYLDDPTKLRTHPVMGRLLKFKRTLMALEELGLGLHPKTDPTHTDGGEKFMDLSDMLGAGSDGSDDSLDESFDGSMDDSELADLLAEQEKENTLRPRHEPVATAEPERKPKKKSKKGKEPATDPAPLAEVGTFDAAKEAEAAVAQAATKGSGKKRKRVADGPSDTVTAQGLGEPEALSEYDKAERAERKRNLQFYTTQISAREAKRGKAKQENMSGDADLPWRDPAAARAAVERKRQAQVLAERAAPAAGTALDNTELTERDEADRKAALADDADDADDGAGYYDLIASSRKNARKAKKLEYDASRLAERDEAMAFGEGELEDGEHRGIGRQIERNKGLTPKRKKEDRNPRVKKRMRYDQAKKKLRSMQATYKGGENAIEGGYGGEASGISSHVIKSRKFA